MAKLDEKLITEFALEVEDGLPLMYTCDLFEISHHTFGNWMKQGESDNEHEQDTLCAKFFREIKKSYAKFIRASKKIIRKGEPGWQGTAWWLERTNSNFLPSTDNANSTEPVIVNPTITPTPARGGKPMPPHK